MTAPRVARVVALLVGYGALVAWLTWPLAAHLTTHLPAPAPAFVFDAMFVGWALAWESHALATHPSHFFDANIFHPAPHALFYGPMGLSSLPYFLPTFLLTGNPTLALNVVLVLGITLTAVALHLVVVRLTGSRLAGFLAAWTLLMTRWALWAGAPLSPNWAVLQYFPPIALLASAPERRFPGLLWLAGLVALQGLVDVYVATALLVPLGVLTLARLARSRTRRAGLRLLGVLALASVVLLLAYAGLIVVRAENPDLLQQTHWGMRQSATVLPWGLFVPYAPTAVPPPVLALIAAGTVVFGAGRGRKSPAVRRAWAVGALWAVVGTVQSLGPVVAWRDRILPLPQAYLGHWLPIYQALREPSRLGVAALIGLAILAGVSFAECTRWLRRPGRWRLPRLVGAIALTVAVATAMYASYRSGIPVPMLGYRPLRLPSSYPLTPAIGDSPLLARLREPGGPVLELPAGMKPEEAFRHAEAMYRSIFHWRPLLNGYSSYWPRAFPERMQLAQRLPDPDALRALRDQTGLEMILVRTNALDAAARQTWLEIATAPPRDVRLVARDGADLLFTVADGPR